MERSPVSTSTSASPEKVRTLLVKKDEDAKQPSKKDLQDPTPQTALMAKEVDRPTLSQAYKIITSFDSGDEAAFVDPLKNLSFPAKLHAILSHGDIEDIVSWMPHGRAWRVHKTKAFELQVIPRFFNKCKYASFVRQLNGW